MQGPAARDSSSSGALASVRKEEDSTTPVTSSSSSSSSVKSSPVSDADDRSRRPAVGLAPAPAPSASNPPAPSPFALPRFVDAPRPGLKLAGVGTPYRLRAPSPRPLDEGGGVPFLQNAAAGAGNSSSSSVHMHLQRPPPVPVARQGFLPRGLSSSPPPLPFSSFQSSYPPTARDLLSNAPNDTLAAVFPPPFAPSPSIVGSLLPPPTGGGAGFHQDADSAAYLNHRSFMFMNFGVTQQWLVNKYETRKSSQENLRVGLKNELDMLLALRDVLDRNPEKVGAVRPLPDGRLDGTSSSSSSSSSAASSSFPPSSSPPPPSLSSGAPPRGAVDPPEPTASLRRRNETRIWHTQQLLLHVDNVLQRGKDILATDLQSQTDHFGIQLQNQELLHRLDKMGVKVGTTTPARAPSRSRSRAGATGGGGAKAASSKSLGASSSFSSSSSSYSSSQHPDYSRAPRGAYAPPSSDGGIVVKTPRPLKKRAIGEKAKGDVTTKTAAEEPLLTVAEGGGGAGAKKSKGEQGGEEARAEASVMRMDICGDVSDGAAQEGGKNSSSVPAQSAGEGIFVPSPLSDEEIEQHLESLNSEIHFTTPKVRGVCQKILDLLLADSYGPLFSVPVDPVKDGLPDYFDVIKEPMDLGLIQQRLESGHYKSLEAFSDDVRLVFDNAIDYNGQKSNVGLMANTLLDVFEKQVKNVLLSYRLLFEKLQKEDPVGDICNLCGVYKRTFEPIALYCNGFCGMQRIRRNAPYYTESTKNNHWCQTCFAQMKDGQEILLQDGTIVTKNKMQKLKNDSIQDESWVQCGTCDMWSHQICALFNERNNKHSVSYHCFKCQLTRRRADAKLKKMNSNVADAAGSGDGVLTENSGSSSGRDADSMRVDGASISSSGDSSSSAAAEPRPPAPAPPPSEPTQSSCFAKDLPKCQLSDALEAGLDIALEAAYQSEAVRRGVRVQDVEKVLPIAVRVVSNIRTSHVVRDEMYNRYNKKKNYSSEFPVHTKCILLFQRIDGVDVLLFGMYVYEYGDDCPKPNRRRVYVSYLDSVQYFRPKQYRTLAYQYLLIEYLRYAKLRGFHTAHIWSCPPSKGDDYVFHCHPVYQRNPSDARLCSWYTTMLEKAQQEGIVVEVNNLYDEYFKNNSNDPTCLPYFEGDYLVGELENIIISVQKEEEDRLKSKGDGMFASGVSAAVKPSSAGPGQRSGTRSNPGELAAEALSLGTRDPVMVKLGASLVKMKQNFLVAHLYSREFVEAIESGLPFSGEDELAAVLRNDTIVSQMTASKSSVRYSLETPEERSPRASSSSFASFSIPTSASQSSLQSIDDDVDSSAGGGSYRGSGEVETAKSLENATSTGSLGDLLGSESADRKSSSPDSGTFLSADQNASFARTDSYPDFSQGGSGIRPEKLAEAQTGKLTRSTSSASNAPASNDEDTGFGTRKKTKPVCHTPSVDVLSVVKPTLPSSIEQLVLSSIEASLTFKRASPSENETVEKDPIIRTEIFDGRQQLLNYCQKNNTQFDVLRRAKHTTVMLLYQLHNPDAAKFLPQCGVCYREINHGIRHHCLACADFDLCPDCYVSVTSGLWDRLPNERGPSRYYHDKRHEFAAVDTAAFLRENALRMAEREKLQEKFMVVLNHACSCGDEVCLADLCKKMKSVILHVQEHAQQRDTQDCKKCKMFFSLVQNHAKECKIRGDCPIVFCARMKEKYKRLKMQQLAMDNRRRRQQNVLFGIEVEGGDAARGDGADVEKHAGGGIPSSLERGSSAGASASGLPSLDKGNSGGASGSTARKRGRGASSGTSVNI